MIHGDGLHAFQLFFCLALGGRQLHHVGVDRSTRQSRQPDSGYQGAELARWLQNTGLSQERRLIRLRISIHPLTLKLTR